MAINNGGYTRSELAIITAKYGSDMTMKTSSKRKTMDINELRVFALEYTKTLISERPDERYRTPREFAEDELSCFLQWIADKIDPKVINLNKQIKEKSEELNALVEELNQHQDNFDIGDV